MFNVTILSFLMAVCFLAYTAHEGIAIAVLVLMTMLFVTVIGGSKQ